MPGESSKAQLIFQQPLCPTHGERFVIRDDSETETLGGGLVLDPNGPKYGKSKPHRIQWLEALEQADMASVVTVLIEQGHCIDFSKLATCFNLKDAPPAVFTPAGCINFQTGGRHWITSKSQLAQTRTALLNTVENCSVADMTQGQKVAKAEPAIIKKTVMPTIRGIAKDQLLDAAGRATHPALAEATLAILLKKGELQSAEGRIRLPVALDAPNPHDVLWQSLERALQAAGLNVPVISEAKSQAGLGDLDLKLAIKRGREVHALHRLNADRFVLGGTLFTFIKVAEQIAANQSLSVVAYKNELNIGRKLAIEILEYFDSLGFTRRDGDQRVIVNKTAIEKRLVT
jgi:selenocysteine-specific elongation factor